MKKIKQEGSTMKITSSILDKVIDTFKDTPINTELTRSEIIRRVTEKHGCNPTSVIPSDYCYNRLNNGINYEKYLHLFEYTDSKTYRYLGLNFPYTGKIIHKPKGGCEIIVGELIDGVLKSYDKREPVSVSDSKVIRKNVEEHIHTTKRNISITLRYQIMKRDNFKCVLCGASPAKDPSIELHIDHIIPWSKGGESTIDNLQTLCSVCNLGKRDSI